MENRIPGPGGGVEFEIGAPHGAPETEVNTRERGEALAVPRAAAKTTAASRSRESVMSDRLPEPRLRLVYRLEATLGEPLDLVETAQGHRRIVPLTGGTFIGGLISGKLVPGASADWQTVLPDATALADIRYVLQTEDGDLLYVEASGVRHGSAEVLGRLGRREDVDPGEYTFRTAPGSRPLHSCSTG
jgi:hypothetical protein